MYIYISSVCGKMDTNTKLYRKNTACIYTVVNRRIDCPPTKPRCVGRMDNSNNQKPKSSTCQEFKSKSKAAVLI
jgi:hypothetical protein